MKDSEKCSKCGFCKADCPIFKEILEEKYSPRTKIILVNEKINHSIFYHCSLCKACEKDCPAGIIITDEIIKMREDLVRRGIETEENKKMIENIRKFGNPYGEEKEGETPKDLYCC